MTFRRGHSFFVFYYLLLSLRFRTVKTIADASPSHRAKLPGDAGATGCWSRRRFHRTWCS